MNDLLSEKKKEGYQLIYLFSTSEIETNHPLVDQKATYKYPITTEKRVELNFYDNSFVSDQLLQLAIDSGEYSRFKMDKNIPHQKFIDLYTLWIENSVNKSFADNILMIEREGDIMGMITVSCDNKVGKIGLIAVNEKYRGLSIGSKLIEQCKYYFQLKNCTSIEVPTQKNNKGACNFYEKNNFTIKSIDYIYHCWI